MKPNKYRSGIITQTQWNNWSLTPRQNKYDETNLVVREGGCAAGKRYIEVMLHHPIPGSVKFHINGQQVSLRMVGSAYRSCQPVYVGDTWAAAYYSETWEERARRSWGFKSEGGGSA